MARKNPTIKPTCMEGHCTDNATSLWRTSLVPKYEGKTINELLNNPPTGKKKKSWELEEFRFIWFYVHVHPVCSQEVLARAMGRTHMATRLAIRRMRLKAIALGDRKVPKWDPEWDFIKPDPNEASSSSSSASSSSSPALGTSSSSALATPVDTPARLSVPQSQDKGVQSPGFPEISARTTGCEVVRTRSSTPEKMSILLDKVDSHIGPPRDWSSEEAHTFK